MSQSSKAAAAERHAKLLRSLASKLRHRNSEQSSAFKDVFSAHQGLLHLNEKLRQQTLQQDKVLSIVLRFCHEPACCSIRVVACPWGGRLKVYFTPEISLDKNKNKLKGGSGESLLDCPAVQHQQF